jgi:PAS domain S-box-containing protein
MLAFQRVVFRMKQEELRLLAIRVEEARRRQAQARSLVVIVFVIGFCMATAAVGQFRREARRRSVSERSLRSSEAKFRGLLEAAPDAMVVANERSEIVLLNARTETQFGYPRSELLGQPVIRILPAGWSALPAHNSEEDHPQAAVSVLEAEAVRKDGSAFPAEIVLSPLAFGESSLIIGAIRDITERKRNEALIVRTNADLERSNAELRRFAYIASHDLQEPLRTVASYTELLARRYRNRLDQDANEFIQFAVDGCKRMKILIQDLLAYARVGEDRAQTIEVESHAALNAAMDNLRSAIRATGAQITFDPLPRVMANSTLLVQVFQNLLSNAIRYRGDRIPRIHVTAQLQGLFDYRFSISDNGVGIDPQYFEKVFVLFQRLHPVEQSEGTGIGLALCKKVVESMGGRIWVESVPGSGSTFHFTLPQAHAQSAPKENRLPESGSLSLSASTERLTTDPKPG